MKTLNSIIEKSKYILSEEGLCIFLDRLIRVSIVKTKRLFINNHENIQKWRGLRDRFKGNRVFLIGNGPSLNRTPLHLLKHEYTICFNRFNLMFERLDWLPTFYCNIDDRVLMDMVQEISEMVPEFQCVFVPDIHPYNINFKKRIKNADNVFWLYLERLSFSLNLPFCGINKTVANVGLQVLAFMGFKEIYMIGVDMDYTDHKTAICKGSRNITSEMDDDPNHFDPRYFGKGRAYHQPRLEETFLRFKEGRDFFKQNGVTIFNAGIGSKLNVFKRVKFNDLFSVNARDEKELFMTSIINNTFVNSVKEIETKKVVINSPKEWCGSYPIVKTNIDIALKLIPKVIFTHIPFGPLYNDYYFIKR